MLRVNNDGAYLISDKDLIIALEYAYNNHYEQILSKLNDLFINVSDVVMIDKTSYHKVLDNNLVSFLLDEVKLINYETFIDRNVLKEAYVISKFEKNIPINKKIHTYLIRFLNNEIAGIPNDVLKSEIINDKLVMKYLKKYDNLDDFITRKINKKVRLQDEYTSVKNKEKKKIA